MKLTNVKSLGCKVNFSDTQAAAARIVFETGPPVEVVGTCCVTGAAEKQSRKEVRRALRRVGPEGRVFVTGCAARLAAGPFEAIGKNVTVLPGPAGKKPLVICKSQTASLPGERFHNEMKTLAGRTRFFLKIQDGCANMCAYCVVPLVRGRPVSLPMVQLLALARAVVEKGCPEIVVCGVDVGAWRDGNHKLADLLTRLARIDGLARLRLSSVEVVHLSPELLETMVAGKVICPHLHVPLQSGDDRVLETMGRRYDCGEFSGRLAAARRALPGVNLTTDVIVGFPGEDGRAFKNTLDFIAAEGFSKVHGFSYSPRPGTRAIKLHDSVPAAEKKRRSQQLLALSRRLGRRHRQRKVGGLSEVLLESAVKPGVFGGYSADYTRFLVSHADGAGLANVRAEAVSGEAVLGKMVNQRGRAF